MAVVHRRVNRLLHGAQEHGMNLLGVRSVFGRLRNLLEFTGRWVVGNCHSDAGSLQIVAQHVFFLGRRAFVNPKQPHVLALRNEISRTHVGSQHGLFNQPMGHIAGTRHDFFDAPGFVTNDLRFGRFKIYRATHATLRQKYLIHIVQVQQMGHQFLALGCFRATGVA